MPDKAKSKKSILIVEDETPLLLVLTDRLKLEGLDAIPARDGEEGLKIALKEHPDLILLDIVMPKKDGMTMLKELRQDSWGKTAPVILLTNVGAPESIAEAVVEGETIEYLVKTDWKLEQVVAKIKDKLGMS